VLLINKNTKIYCSFSSNPGNNGCVFFNKKFQENNIDAIYKSFYSDNIKKSVEAVKTLGISGFAISMPFKTEILKHVDKQDNIKFKVILRNEWDRVIDLEDLVFNATPVDVKIKGTLIDGRPHTSDGKIIANLQAEEQYKLYTNEQY
jgi:shikimate 5-dehydrogenase